MGILASLADDYGTVASWLLVALLALSIPANAAYGDIIWTAFLLADLAILVLPAVVSRDASMTLPPVVVALAVLPALTRSFGPAWATDWALYVAVAAVSLAAVVDLTLFTEVEMSPWFADVTVVLTTMAAIGVWAILQFYSDRYLRTNLIGSLNAVMWEFVRATVAGVVAAAFFEAYFYYRAPAGETGPEVLGDGGDGA